ncbi:hypothetical protein [Erwinia rhapontici]|uniref:hypothetical protein n=1 Tax=Erwinia rhapontici TaxID=55212 RepID=UPI00133186D1|nr:hypothetical protein [Erwinia rhapontici]MBP2157379.1 DNA-binding NarL/FixJ family response regulator [Erwinia rhapontici]
MAAVDPIENTQLCKYFPALTPKQVTNLCFYSTGANYQDISSLLETAPGTIKKSIESVQKHYSARSLPELKTVFWACLTFHLICAKYSIDGEKFVATIHLDAICALRPVFPELNKHQLAGAVLYSIGHSIRDIALKSHHTSSQVEQHIIEAMDALRTDSEQLLRMSITSRFIMDLC